MGVRRGRSRVDSAALVAPNPSQPEPVATAAMTRAERHALGRRLLAEGGVLWSALPVEWPTEGAKGSVADPPELPGYLWRVRASLGALLRRPRASFAYVHEPVAHGAVLRLLHTLRLPLWLALLAALALRATLMPATATALRPVHEVLDPRLSEVLSLWLLLMVPIGLPLLYFALGMATHVALALTGGAPRSIAATMRATGCALAPTLLLLAVLDLPLHLGALSGTVYFCALGAALLLFFHQTGQALTGTHAISPVRGHVVAVVPLAMVLAVQVGRALLVLPDVPGWQPAPAHPYFIP